MVRSLHLPTSLTVALALMLISFAPFLTTDGTNQRAADYQGDGLMGECNERTIAIPAPCPIADIVAEQTGIGENGGSGMMAELGRSHVGPGELERAELLRAYRTLIKENEGLRRAAKRTREGGASGAELLLARAGLTRETLRALLLGERELRLSDELQRAYGDAEQDTSPDDWLVVTEAMQRRLIDEAGVPDERKDTALHMLRSAASLIPEMQEARASIRVKHTRAHRGALRTGDAVPPGIVLHPLHACESGPIALEALCAAAPVALIAGSYT
jgi:hypothetical protein